MSQIVGQKFQDVGQKSQHLGDFHNIFSVLRKNE